MGSPPWSKTSLSRYAPRPWGMQPDTSPLRHVTASTCAFLHSCLSAYYTISPPVCAATSIRSHPHYNPDPRILFVSVIMFLSHLDLRFLLSDYSYCPPPAQQPDYGIPQPQAVRKADALAGVRIQTPPVCGNDVQCYSTILCHKQFFHCLQI